MSIEDLSPILYLLVIGWIVLSRWLSRRGENKGIFVRGLESEGKEEWWAVLEVMPDASRAEIDRAFQGKSADLSKGLPSIPTQDEITKRARRRARLEAAYREGLESRSRIGVSL